jgi:hypothetical protein
MSPQASDIKPDGTAAHQNHDVGDRFHSIEFIDEWQTLHVKTLQQKEDDEFVRDCPEGVDYETNRQRYIASIPPVNKVERVTWMLRNGPHRLRNGAQGAQSLAQNALAQTTKTYDEGGSAAVASSVLGTSLALARNLRSALLAKTNNSHGGNWYATQRLLCHFNGGRQW